MPDKNRDCRTPVQDITIRPFIASDLDVIISRQLVLYAEEYGFTSAIWEDYLTRGVRGFAERYDSRRDCLLIAEYRREPCGCIAITHTDDTTGQLRFFFLVKEMRGNGTGRRLIDRAVAFCNECGYKRVFLWTFSTLVAARHLYAAKGFQITDTRVNNDWGGPILEEKWELEL